MIFLALRIGYPGGFGMMEVESIVGAVELESRRTLAALAAKAIDSARRRAVPDPSQSAGDQVSG